MGHVWSRESGVSSFLSAFSQMFHPKSQGPLLPCEGPHPDRADNLRQGLRTPSSLSGHCSHEEPDPSLAVPCGGGRQVSLQILWQGPMTVPVCLHHLSFLSSSSSAWMELSRDISFIAFIINTSSEPSITLSIAPSSQFPSTGISSQFTTSDSFSNDAILCVMDCVSWTTPSTARKWSLLSVTDG